MKNASARTTYLKDYRPPSFTIETTDLHFDLYEDHATVVSKLLFKRNDASDASSLELHGQPLPENMAIRLALSMPERCVCLSRKLLK